MFSNFAENNKIQMKKRILLILTALCLAGTLSAQVVKSDRFISMNGTRYYLHKITEGQSLEDIAKAYQTTVQDIKMNNQDKTGKFQPGILIKIPVLSNNSTPPSTQEFAYHTVEKKQTLYSICQKYGVNEEDVYKYNPEARFGIKSGETLKIPVGHVDNPDRQNAEFIYHSVKQNESINSICVLYKVDINDLLKYNPKAKTDFKAGMILTLPKTPEYMNRNNSDGEDEPEMIDQQDLVRLEAGKNSDYCPCENFTYNRSKTIRIAVMLPLFISENAAKIDAYRQDPNKNSLYSKNSEKIYEFYEGVLMATRDYQLRGFNIQLDILDTENSTSKTNEICSNPELKKADLIIGPLYTDNVIKAAKFAKDNQIAMVSPFAIKNDLLKDNPYLFQMTPSNATSIEETLNYFAGLEGSNVVLVYDNEGNNNPNEISLIKNYRDIIKKVDNLTLKEINYDNGGASILKSALNSAQNNIVIMTSTKEVFISKVFNYLNGLVKNDHYKILLFGSQSWEKIGNIDIEFLQGMNFSYRSSSFVNYNNGNVKTFISEFRSRFNSEPGIYAFSGFDITNYFLGQISKKGKYFHFCPDDPSQGLVYKFEFRKVAPLGGYENHSNYVLQYSEDYTLQEAE